MRYVLTLPVVQQAISTLQQKRIHETFIAFLHVKYRSARLGRSEGVNPEWNIQVREWLEVPGGPPNKPHYRPFGSRGSDKRNFWMNANLAGSYAPSSLRGMRDYLVDENGTYKIPTRNNDTDVAKVLEVFLYKEPIPAWAVAAFIYRNRAFVSQELPSPRDLLEVFKEDFRWSLPEQEIFLWNLPPFELFFEEHR